MPLAFRVIPKLDIKGSDLVKGIKLEGLRVLGKPEIFAKKYYEDGADELIYQDVVASLYNRNGLHEIIEKTASKIFIPLTVGGGIRTIDDIKKILRSGADKVSINTAAHEKPDFISNAAKTFGTSTVVVSIEAIKQKDGNYIAFTDNGRNSSGREVISWARRVEKLGAGELLLINVDVDGTGLGPDIELVNKISKAVKIPVIVQGGFGDVTQVRNLVENSNAKGVALSSILHYKACMEFSTNNLEGNTQFLTKNKGFGLVQKLKIQNIKSYLDKSTTIR